MRLSLAEKLRKVLESKSKDEVTKEWQAIEQLELGGPSLEEAMSYFININNNFSFSETTHAYNFRNLDNKIEVSDNVTNSLAS